MWPVVGLLQPVVDTAANEYDEGQANPKSYSEHERVGAGLWREGGGRRGCGREGRRRVGAGLRREGGGRR